MVCPGAVIHVLRKEYFWIRGSALLSVCYQLVLLKCWGCSSPQWSFILKMLSDNTSTAQRSIIFRILWFVLQGQQYETALAQISSFLSLWTGREFWEMDFNCCFVKKSATLFCETQEPLQISFKWPELQWKLHWKQWNRVTFCCTAMIKKFNSYIYKSSIFVAQSWSRRYQCLIMLVTWLRLKSWNWMADLMPWSTSWAQDYAYVLHKDPMTFHHISFWYPYPQPHLRQIWQTHFLDHHKALLLHVIGANLQPLPIQ